MAREDGTYTAAEVSELIGRDPRVQLMERLYTDNDAKKALQQHSKRLFPTAAIPEIDIPAAIEPQLKVLRDENAALKERLDKDALSRRHAAFRDELKAAGAEDADLDKIETFMVENELGPKSIKIAVEKFYEGKEAAEPNGADLLLPWQREGGVDKEDAEHLKRLLSAGPGEDLDLINAPFVERNFNATVAAMNGGRRR